MQKTHDVTITLKCERTLTFEVELPWPAKELSPNARQHWAAAARAKKAYRGRCRALGLVAGLALVPTGAKRLAVHLDFFPPDRRARDWDNMIASMKAGLDGLADAMGVDDSRWRLGFKVWDEPVKEGRVVATVEVQA